MSHVPSFCSSSRRLLTKFNKKRKKKKLYFHFKSFNIKSLNKKCNFVLVNFVFVFLIKHFYFPWKCAWKVSIKQNKTCIRQHRTKEKDSKPRQNFWDTLQLIQTSALTLNILDFGHTLWHKLVKPQASQQMCTAAFITHTFNDSSSCFFW